MNLAETTEFGATYWNLVRALRERRVVPFIGAGVSMALRGAKSWADLLDGLMTAAKQTYDLQGERLAMYFKALGAHGKTDPLFVADQIRNYLGKGRLPEELKNMLAPSDSEPREDTETLSEILKRLSDFCPGGFVTTNYDSFLEQALHDVRDRRRVEHFTHEDVSRYAAFLRSSESEDNGRTIFHLHGHFGRETSLVLTESQYQQLYSRSEVEGLLQAIFATKSALFIGFSLEDDDVMAVFRRIMARFPSMRERHFAIVPEREPRQSFARGWLRLLSYERKYGIGLLEYPESEHAQAWTILDSALREAKRTAKRTPVTRAVPIALVPDVYFPDVEAIQDVADQLNGVQDQVHYEVRTDCRLEMDEDFPGSMPKRVDAFNEVDYWRRQKGIGLVFVLTNRRDVRRYQFFDRRRFSWASTAFWKTAVERPSLGEYLKHVVVLLTLHYFARFEKDSGVERGDPLSSHEPDRGCLFDFTRKLPHRIAIVDCPWICDECRAALERVYPASQEFLGMSWLNRVLRLSSWRAS